MKEVAVIHEGFLGKRQLVLISTLILLLGCIIPMAALIPSVGADVPSATGSHLAYWHIQDGIDNIWANTNPDDANDSGTISHEEYLATPTTVDYGLPVKANMGDDDLLDEPLYFDNNAKISGEVWVEISVSGVADPPTEITFYAYEEDGGGNRLNTWPITVDYKDDGKYTIYIDIYGVTVPAGHIFGVGFNFEAQPPITTITFHTSGDSRYDLPLVVGSDGDGGDGDGDGDGDGGDGDGTDGNATEGDEEDNSTMLMIIVIIVIVLVLVAVIIGIRKRG